ncbi:sugar ABC transporter substrate-binding protein [Amycolatopsis jejuensis]|uniref:sugar ABC transporter substrate-binding protein n=1 Tax=Amycolatopsis jejuensis TaxID=330084 RepID=UPI000527DC8B|nr:substrate-binding domain-containing protein [Amycolatopsis jejuensis]
MFPKSRKAAAAAVGAVLCLVLAACGGNAGGSDKSGSLSGAEQQAIADAKATYDEYRKPRPAEAVPELPSPAPTGKNFSVITCNFPVCKSTSDGAVAAAEKLGWKVTVLQDDSTPQSYVSVMNQVAANPPDALAYVPVLPDSSVQAQLDKLKAAGTKIVEIAPLGEAVGAGGAVQGVVLGSKDLAMSGRLMGAAVVADAGAPAKAVFVWDPSFRDGWSPMKKAFDDAISSAGGTPDVLEAALAGIGKTVPAQIVSYLQAHPDTPYVALGMVNYNAGLNEALQAAGLLGKVKVISRAANSATLGAVKSGKEWASVAIELAACGYRAVDSLVRLMMGLPLGDRANVAGWQQIFVKDTVPPTGAQPEPPDYAQAYHRAWHVG